MIDAQIQQRAEEAEQLLNNPAFTKVMAEERQDLMHRWTEQLGAEEREKLWHQYQALEAFEQNLRERINTLAMAVRREERKTK